MIAASARLLLLVGLSIVSFSIPAQSLEDAIVRIKPSIVAVGTYQPGRNPAFKFRGTGFVVGDGKTVVTNAHVLPTDLDVFNNEKLVVARPLEGKQVEARNVQRGPFDEAHDLALLHMSTPMPALKVGDSSALREGALLGFTGFPLGGAIGLVPATHRATLAAITPIAMPSPRAAQLDSATVKRLARESFPVFQLDATAYPGNSGSPLYAIDSGEVIGVVNMVFVKQSKEAVLAQPSGITYAIPAEHLRALLNRVKEATP